MRRIFPLFIVTLILALPAYAEAPKILPPKAETKVESTRLSNCFLEAKTSGQEEYAERPLFSGLENKPLIKCLAWYESSYRTDVYGDSGRAYGVMQFHQPTFNLFCEGDYYNSRDQVVCADKMISSNWNLVYHWSTAKFCI